MKQVLAAGIDFDSGWMVISFLYGVSAYFFSRGGERGKYRGGKA